jgi:hypothetical protein
MRTEPTAVQRQRSLGLAICITFVPPQIKWQHRKSNVAKASATRCSAYYDHLIAAGVAATTATIGAAAGLCKAAATARGSRPAESSFNGAWLLTGPRNSTRPAGSVQPLRLAFGTL